MTETSTAEAPVYTLEGATGPWEIVVGMEVHAQVVSRSKLFSGASTEYGAEPNTHVSLVDAAMPGMLPVINAEVVAQAVRTGLALDARINKWSRFDRKNYFYADLPQGYQISQFQYPIVGEGEIHLDLGDGRTKTVGVERIHLEQDAGKSMHDQHPRYTFVDLNRSGVALMEIVSKPDIRSPEEAGAYLKKLRTILRYIGTCDGNMEQGSMRADVNVSVRKAGAPYGTRCEIKNVNSVRFVMMAIEVEAQRQIDILEAGGAIDQETRLFDPTRMETRSMRNKEEAHDYRYFPDPDLLPLEFDDAFVDRCRADLPELPDQKKQRLIDALGLPDYNAGVLVAEKESAAYFDTLLAALVERTGKQPAEVALKASNFVIGELFAHLNKAGLDIAHSPVSADAGAELLALQEDGTISGRIAKDVFEKMVETGKPAGQIVEEEGLKQIADTGALEAICDQVIADNPKQLEQYKAGKEKLLGFFVGQAMKATGGKANPQAVNEILKAKLAQA
ncbi:aspartyl/glutamyl-tRNA amidotransferase subunit B [Rhodothalassium salexigens]|uniref:Asp-tRNA(Asn)/Glu-tRNA(Gln) amidotransferase subunit GatB n=1 Tax=Rhodothalassium salexigens TaxID=1086 RepID=UPI00191174E1|nr:Asp-tRNA(Asn)/Glu-tRNA(Gln) amidotransferase subunit GatB [Rhodothalassium salexigens]MBK5910668.1 aspartyl/glutamyl-tRNA amidotransferase subunit B [Rhodothalassium salexigens]MBK5920603.1 aspartyl/glutamyl-tRNA amidotransferase subunit B [Rhodothalassium salexigens]